MRRALDAIETMLGLRAMQWLLVMLVIGLAFLLFVRSRRLARTASAQIPGPVAPAEPASPLPEAEAEDRDEGLFTLVRPSSILLIIAGIAAALWLVGLSLAPDRARFLASREWHIQPIYLAAHVVALALFIGVLKRNFEAGLARMDIDPGPTRARMRLLLGPLGILVAVAIAIPLGFLDYQYLLSPRYEKLGGDGVVRAADLVMWGIWCLEWGLNAFLWVMLAGFAAKSCWIISRHRFRAPIEVALLERHYRPFLQMSAQGSTILLAFSFVTVSYILYAGGEVSDYVGLVTSILLLILGFFVPWMLLRARVRAMVEAETQALRRDLVTRVRRGQRPALEAPLESRVEELLAIVRISHVEHLRTNLGWTEAKLLLLRLLAPAATILWQLAQNAGDIGQRLARLLQDLGVSLAAWLG